MRMAIIGGMGHVGQLLIDYWKVKNLDVISTWQIHIYDTHAEELRYRKHGGEIAVDEIRSYDIVLYLGGISRNQAEWRYKNYKNKSLSGDDTALDDLVYLQNVKDLDEVLHKMTKDQLLIYASSAALYLGHPGLSDESIQPLDSVLQTDRYVNTMYRRENHVMSSSFGVQTLGLRLGSVVVTLDNTKSQRDSMMSILKREGLRDNFVSVSNPNAWRAFLTQDDLGRGVSAILNAWHSRHQGTANRNDPFIEQHSVLNISSFNITIGNLGEQIAKALSLPLRIIGSTNDCQSIGFALDNQKFERTFNFKFIGSAPETLRCES